MSLLEFRGVSKCYGKHTILEDISFRLLPGQTVALLGASGSGKSTILRLANGLLGPDHGQVLFLGQSLTQASRSRIGTVLQEGGLFPHLTIEQNLFLLPRDKGWATQDLIERTLELVQLLRLPHDCLERYPHQLSGGQRQRAAIARALFLSPPLLLLDEPFGALDPHVRRELQDELKLLFQRLDCGVILVTHDLAEAAHFAEHICVLECGRLLEQGGYSQLLQSGGPSFQRLLSSFRPLPSRC